MTDALETIRTLCRYRHDAQDRLAIVDPGAQDSVLRFYQKSRLTVEIQGAVRRRIFQSGDHLLAEHSMEGSAARVDMLGTDVQRSVLHAVTAQERQSLVYSPYGHRLQGTQVPGFNGERADPVTGHYLLGNGYRAFNPVLMRFNNPDTLSPFGRGGLNAYAYCLGDPVNVRDPSGHFAVLNALSSLMNRVGGRLGFVGRSGASLAVFPIETLPLEITRKIINVTPRPDLESWAKTSRKWGSIIEDLLTMPKRNRKSTGVLWDVHNDLFGTKPRVSLSRLKNSDDYRAVVRHIGSQEGRAAAENHILRQQKEQFFSQNVRPGARYKDFVAKVWRLKRPDPEEANSLLAGYRGLLTSSFIVEDRRLTVDKMIDDIRAKLDE
ncbi:MULTISPECIES: RHS repeat-associated core domain-containing protein [Pseudomonas syringae group]|uniref:RHS repeat-associated core domain-containing protein n=1 Tax=Pseudomonas syringae group TaxID=136849 RepID=UPI000F039F69|nr:RHS repeat-associated core domain-containing protein [Pseudomonas viridiflava]